MYTMYTRSCAACAVLALPVLCLVACGDASLGDRPDPGDCADPATWFSDGDQDGFGDAAKTTIACEVPAGFVADSTDCNDGDKAVHPGARDICGDDIDNSCVGADQCQASLRALWLFDDASGTAVRDSSGKGHDGILRGGAAFVPGTAAIHFSGADGVNDFIEVAHSDDFLLAEGTVSLWFRADTLVPDPASPNLRLGLWSKDSSGFDTGGHLSLWVEPTGVMTMRLQSVAGAVPEEVVLLSQTLVTIQTWHHLAGTFGPGGVHLYLDGKEEASNPYTGGIGPTSGGIGNFEPLGIGSLTFTSGDLVITPTSNPHEGDISNVRVYASALSLADIDDLIKLTMP